MAATAPGPARVLALFDALGEWFAEPGFNGCLADRLMLLVEGAIVTAHVEGDADAALRGRSAAAALLDLDRLAATTEPPN